MPHLLFIVWKDSYNTGIPILDEQHRGLVSTINSFFFHRSETTKDIERILVPTADMFKSYVKINLLTIEKLMAVSAYPKREEHQLLHATLISHIDLMETKYRKIADAQGFLEFIKNYWLTTMENSKKEYIPHILAYYRNNR